MDQNQCSFITGMNVHFDRYTHKGEKYESVLQSGEYVVGYCALVRDHSQDGFRAFVVLDWTKKNVEIQAAVLLELERLILESSAEYIWMRELKGDVSLIEFMLSNGFEIEKCYQYNGLEWSICSRFIDLYGYSH